MTSTITSTTIIPQRTFLHCVTLSSEKLRYMTWHDIASHHITLHCMHTYMLTYTYSEMCRFWKGCASVAPAHSQCLSIRMSGYIASFKWVSFLRIAVIVHTVSKLCQYELFWTQREVILSTIYWGDLVHVYHPHRCAWWTQALFAGKVVRKLSAEGSLCSTTVQRLTLAKYVLAHVAWSVHAHFSVDGNEQEWRRWTRAKAILRARAPELRWVQVKKIVIKASLMSSQLWHIPVCRWI